MRASPGPRSAACEKGVSRMNPPSQRRRGIVTGAGSGIGKAVVLRMLREGVEALAVDIDAGRLSQLENAGCETLVADITEP